MTKPFDFKDLVTRLKAAGVVDAEKVAVDVLNATLGWTSDSLALEASPYAMMAVPLLGILKTQALALIDKIDGVQDLPKA